MLQRLSHRIYASVVLLCLSTVIHAAEIWIWQVPENEGRAPVFYQKPSKFSSLSPIFKPNQTVQVLCQQKDWAKIAALDNSGQEAWTPSSEVKAVTKLTVYLKQKKQNDIYQVIAYRSKEPSLHCTQFFQPVDVEKELKQLFELDALFKERLGYSLAEIISKRLGRPLHEAISEFRDCSLDECIRKILGYSLDEAIEKIGECSLEEMIKAVKGCSLDEAIQEILGCSLDTVIQKMKERSLYEVASELLGSPLDTAVKKVMEYSSKAINNYFQTKEWRRFLDKDGQAALKEILECSLAETIEGIVGCPFDEVMQKMKALSSKSPTTMIAK